ncbi:MAG: integrase [Deltaproteobacteria bacterium GWC2_42_51]|nr:MAG: integrase [Deltaproteobacteria bacterium GWA2_42_85]OGP31697.1 MAG: integrase [Deltaproteobacteria bacterium GWC2_42_51]OGP43876.1 MAG: integrase [Deltaproteobacteria bacterium GWD2_42_10]OGP46772.1 MAG: integrase [Deltaproteobacteria bacterium GWF2_42_12]OGQ29975.1 MAG: integrase [Deltaproteobacteria bacterium RIFCSPHIGHO2_02_FULL_42_44]OGQ35196.1 MAG: integrase [Deltaproteobacteria bacterium RIFCSPLOWO2_02_FULL_42_39]HAG49808.1 integrase [Deltaproteobacteria bacterium]
MSPVSKREYLEAVFLRYKRASRQLKTIILNEFCTTCKYHRKHAIRLLRKFKRFIKPKVKKRGRKPVYDKEAILKPLKRIWLAANLPCSKRLKVILPLWLPGYLQIYGELPKEVVNALIAISPATIDRLLKPVRVRYKGRGRATTKPGTLLRKQIPIKTNQWDEARPGFLEADTVAHCGESLMGMFAYTVDCVDIATGWTEQRAVWGKGEHGVMAQIHDIEKKLPFPLLGFDSDNGSEFLNYHLLRHFTERKKPVQFTRSRAYHKDDNAHIEQKNWTHVRQWLGYHRLDNPDVVPLLNKLYTQEWRLFHNFFCPSVKLVAKQRIASKTIKRYDSPKTPFQRIMESSHIADSVKQNLKEQSLSLNPFLLRKAMELKLKKVFELCYKPKL